ncbi:DUF397 domain-containing protein [Streptomyces lycii]|uniref:DUF397 domain-containing protein n=1 Tax=Streptomyces lycii TaxID=2654337 RepID=A0ABQ7FPK3_9ACTN|nr:DUF397 domain-containing protein [Streptomyces lycii]KAF4410859.1 DUF397 domain-containing protein [Streptomyces lycii]
MREQTVWQKSSFSQEEGECMEIATLGPAVALRESDDPGTVLTTTPAALDGLIRAVKADVFTGRPEAGR